MTSELTPATERESQAIRALSARWLRAVDARDADQAASFYADDGVFLVPNVPMARGQAAVRAVWAQLLAAPGLSLAWTPTSIEVAGAGGMACEIGWYKLSMNGPNGRIEDDGKYVVVWRRHDEAWHVVADAFNSSHPLQAEAS